MSDNTRNRGRPVDGTFRKTRICFRTRRIGTFTDEVFVAMAGGIAAGGARRDRTDDLLLAKQALSQLSYGPAPVISKILGTQPKRDWWAWEDLNFRPHAYQARALTS